MRKDLFDLIQSSKMNFQIWVREVLLLLTFTSFRFLKYYMGIHEKNTETKIKSINQEIYKQIRHTLDSSMKEYREKNPVNIEQVITNLTESEENEKTKNDN